VCFSDVEGPIRNHTSFEMYIDPEMWETIKPRLKSTDLSSQHKYTMTASTWTNEFVNYFRQNCTEAMKGCKLYFKQHKVNEPFNPDKAQYYVYTTPNCRREGCKMQYHFGLTYKPKINEGARFIVR